MVTALYVAMKVTLPSTPDSGVAALPRVAFAMILAKLAAVFWELADASKCEDKKLKWAGNRIAILKTVTDVCFLGLYLLAAGRSWPTCALAFIVLADAGAYWGTDKIESKIDSWGKSLTKWSDERKEKKRRAQALKEQQLRAREGTGQTPASDETAGTRPQQPENKPEG